MTVLFRAGVTERARTGLGAVLGVIPAAERGYDGFVSRGG